MDGQTQALNLLANLGRHLRVVSYLCGLSLEDSISAIRKGYEAPDDRNEDEKNQTDSLTPTHVHIIKSVLFRWRNDPKYIDKTGSAVPLARASAELSVRGLIEETIEASSSNEEKADVEDILRALLASDAVEQLENQKYRPIKTWFRINPGSGPATLKHLEWIVEFAESISQNLRRPGEGREIYVSRVQRFPSRNLPIVRSMINEEGLEFIEKVNDYLEKERVPPSSGEETVHVGVGVYLFTKD